MIENPHTAIAMLRRMRGETLEAFGAAIGIASKGRVSELERGLVQATPEQALAIERLARESGVVIDAAKLNPIVAMARSASSERIEPWQSPRQDAAA